MAKGNIAKTNIISKLREAFGEDFVGVVDKKVYVYADDGGEKVQIAISMTCPKVEIAADGSTASEVVTNSATVTPAVPAQTSAEEQQQLDDLFAKLGF